MLYLFSSELDVDQDKHLWEDHGGALKVSTLNPSYTLSRNVISKYAKYAEMNTTQLDMLSLACASKSRMRVTTNCSSLHIGDDIMVEMELYNGYGKPIQTGGDLLRVWMTDTQHRASVAGYVIDHGDGTYTGVVKALWSGRPTLKVSVANVKEHIAIYMNVMKEYGTSKYINAIFYKANKHKQDTTTCSAVYKPPSLRDENFCNFTKENFNMAFYCVAPKGYTCEDWKEFGINHQILLDKDEIKVTE